MRWTRTLIPTLKESPAEAEAKSHVLMLRAGMIRRLGSGTYSYLPLGLRTLNKIVHIVRQEMDRAGALEILMPALWPIELFQQSGRLEVFAEDLMKLTDRHGRLHALAPTHEEVVTALVRDNVASYRQLPVNLYQIQTKFRDEPRPRFGILRTREFIMKDAYSFDMDEEGLEESYRRMYDAYCRIFDRCGLPYVVVEAESGAMGGSGSHEFMVPCETGTADYVQCPRCGYAANVERAEVAPVPRRQTEAEPELKEVATPGRTTIEQVSEFLGVSAGRMIKTLIYLADGEPVAALVRGDHEINEKKLAALLGAASVELADAATIQRVTGAPVGFAGPVGLKGLKIVSDYAVCALADGVTGANKEDAHLVGVVPGRDYQPDVEADIRVATHGDACARCGAPLNIYSAVEVGHIFKLGTKYSEAIGAKFLDARGKERSYVMGCYGIGINRIMAAAVESSADGKGIAWSPEIAPYQALVLPLDLSNEKVKQASEEAYKALRDGGLDTLLDDRSESPGVKFNDADLIGFPVRVVIGKGYLRTGEYEVQVRRNGRSFAVAPEAVVQAVSTVLWDPDAEVERGGDHG